MWDAAVEKRKHFDMRPGTALLFRLKKMNSPRATILYEPRTIQQQFIEKIRSDSGLRKSERL